MEYIPEPNETNVVNHNFYKTWVLKKFLHSNKLKMYVEQNHFFILLHIKLRELHGVPKDKQLSLKKLWF